MANTTEGVILTSSQKGGFSGLPEHIDQQLNTADAAVKSLPHIARRQFVEDVKKAVGNINDPQLPMGIRPILARLLAHTHLYLKNGDEKSFIQLCENAVETCGKGWSYLSYWISTEQSLCYSIFWGLKASMERHNKHMAMYLGSKNDGLPQNDPELPSHNKNKNITRLCEWREKYFTSPHSKQSSSKFMKFLQQKAKVFQENLQKSFEANSISHIDHYLLAKQHVYTNNKLKKK